MARVLVLGAGGFIGRHVAQRLVQAGHEVVRGVRDAARAGGAPAVAVDYMRDHDVADWVPRLRGIDAVVNAVGILRETRGATFAALHVAAPRALFAACVEAGVRRVVQISALGADGDAASRYHRSKKAADDFLATLPVASAIVQPSLAYAPDGASARLFTMLASLPVVPVPGKGAQQVQPVHVDDLAALVARLVEGAGDGIGRIPAVGPRALSMRDWLATLRISMNLGRPVFLPVPMRLVSAAARLAEHVPRVLFDRETLGMLERGNTASAATITRILGHAPRDPRDFIEGRDAAGARTAARLSWLLPLLRASVAAVWIATGVVSAGLYPVEASYALLARTGITGALAPVALYGAALLDLALGVGIYVVRRRRWLWRAQIALILAYTAIIAVYLPEHWLHPYGPLTKNLPLLAALLLLHELDEPPGRDERQDEAQAWIT